MPPEPAVAVLYTSVEVTGDDTGDETAVEVSATRGMSTPLFVDEMSSLAAGVLVPTPTFWDITDPKVIMAARRVISFFIVYIAKSKIRIVFLLYVLNIILFLI